MEKTLGSRSSTPFLKTFANLPWESRFLARFPGDPERTNFTRLVKDITHSEVQSTPVKNPKLVGWSLCLANELEIKRPDTTDKLSLELLAGNHTLPSMRPYAARYGGHQFGNWAGQLGDGRAITLGEAVTPRGRLEFQLKGSGPTPYSRRADGRAVLRSSLREFLCSEAMHFLGVPTTRALSLVLTGEEVVRDMFYDGNPQSEPGAIVCRVSPSFLRFGNFQILAAHQENDLLKKLTDYLIEDHYPNLKLSDPDVYGKLLDEISKRTAQMVAHWMRVGFVHGVMNTDNMSALGLTIDYGPYGWLEPFDPDWTPNTTDAEGRRYRYGGQPSIAQWNLMRLCEALYPLIQNEERLHASLEIYSHTFRETHLQMLSQKLGFASIDSPESIAHIEEMFALMRTSEADYTLFFRSLCDWKSTEESAAQLDQLIAPTFYRPLDHPQRDRWLKWLDLYSNRSSREGALDEVRSRSMKKANPKYVPRNYLAQNAIKAAENGDFSVLDRLMRVLQNPYDDQPDQSDLAAKRPDWAANTPGCSALSCSS